MTNPIAVRLVYGFEPATTATHLERALRRIDQCSLIDRSTDGPPISGDERLLWVESGVDVLPTIDELAAGVAAAWLIDTHRGMRWRVTLAGAFDVAFVAQFDAVAPVRARGTAAEWLPMAAPAELCGPGPDLAARDFDVAFVGQCPPGSLRESVLDALRPRFSMAPTSGFLAPEQMMDLYRSSRIVVNLPWSGDLNMRTFEATGARALLVTGPATRIEDALPTGSYFLVGERDAQAWVRAIEAALANPDAQAAADEAYWHVISHHTYDHRARTVLEVLEMTPRCGISRTARAEALSAAYARWGRTDAVADLPLPRAQRSQRIVEAIVWQNLMKANGYRRRRRLVRPAPAPPPPPPPASR